MDRIASAVISGIQLTGGVGYVVGTMFGVLINGLIQTTIMFQGNLNSWWTKIVVGLLTLVFIVMQSAISSTRKSRMAAQRIEEGASARGTSPDCGAETPDAGAQAG